MFHSIVVVHWLVVLLDLYAFPPILITSFINIRIASLIDILFYCFCFSFLFCSPFSRFTYITLSFHNTTSDTNPYFKFMVMFSMITVMLVTRTLDHDQQHHHLYENLGIHTLDHGYYCHYYLHYLSSRLIQTSQKQ